MLQPILVRSQPDEPGVWQIIAGERRWRASQVARLTEVPIVVREMDDVEVFEVAIIENVQRADLNPLEEAQGLKRLRAGRMQPGVSALFQEALDDAGRGAITTEMRPADEAGPFWPAELYHQQYLSKHPGGYCNHGFKGVTCPVGVADLPAQTDVLRPR